MISAVTNVSKNLDKATELFIKHKKLVYWVYRRIRIESKVFVDEQDLISAGFYGLAKAIKTYDNSTKFATWAVHIIKQNMFIELRKAKAKFRIPKTRICSLETEIEQEDGSVLYLGDMLAGDNLDKYEIMLDVKSFMSSLKCRDADLFTDYIAGYSQQELSEKYGLSQPGISRCLVKIKNKFKEYYYYG